MARIGPIWPEVKQVFQDSRRAFPKSWDFWIQAIFDRFEPDSVFSIKGLQPKRGVFRQRFSR